MNAIVVTDEGTLRSIIADEVAKAMSRLCGVTPQSEEAADPERLVTPAELAELLAVSPRTLRRLMQEPGAIPPAIMISGRMPRWRLSEVMAMIENHGKTPKFAKNRRFHSIRNAGSMSPTNGGKPRG